MPKIKSLNTFIDEKIKLYNNKKLSSHKDLYELLGAELWWILNEYYNMSENEQNYIKESIINLNKYHF